MRTRAPGLITLHQPRSGILIRERCHKGQPQAQVFRQRKVHVHSLQEPDVPSRPPRFRPGTGGKESLSQAEIAAVNDQEDRASDAAAFSPLQHSWTLAELRERLAYTYFNWRRDTWSDLQLFMALNFALVLLGGYLKGALLDPAGDGAFISKAFWERVYSILVVVTGQELPEETAGTAQQVFGLIVAAVGLAAFALVLALVEQVVLQILDDNGSPLVPDDLRMVSASSAAATVIVSDSSRSPADADAEALRSAILLDELDFPGFGEPDPRGQIVVEIKSPNTLAMLHYACSSRITALQTGVLNARRMSRMVTHPVVAATSNTIWNFTSQSQVYLHGFPQLAGTRFGDLGRRFPDATVYGLIRQRPIRRCVLNPDHDLQLEEDDQVILLRPTGLAPSQFEPRPQPVEVPAGRDWSPKQYHAYSVKEPDSASADASQHCDRTAGLSGRPAAYSPQGPRMAVSRSKQASFQYMLPLTFNNLAADGPENVIICGWGDDAFMGDLFEEMDHGPAALAPESRITLFNNTVSPQRLQLHLKAAHVHRLTFDLVSGDPLNYQHVASRLDVTRYTTAIVLCDQSWRDPDLDSRNGIEVRSRRGMLRLESQILLAQLHIRKRLEEQGYPLLNIICEKVAVEGVTRFEDRFRLPVGISVNTNAFSAKLLTQALYNPCNILVFAELGSSYELSAQSSQAFVEPAERISYWQLMARVQAVGQILFGYYKLPSHVEQPIDFSINPIGDEWRSEPRAWSAEGDNVKLLILAPKARFSLQEAVVREAADMPPTEAAAHILVNSPQWGGQGEDVVQASVNMNGVYNSSTSSSGL
ncbi:hypothetical protein WJX73_007473 [Symbiochloris irregularis]|uniref:CASTOR/POLLUX/SYM8 ion channel conserved domain-containing protein n=1 Tax=Symbiochloris irregularis TaxID=706552 RepID=A0AAW1PGP1_9CHLO